MRRTVIYTVLVLLVGMMPASSVAAAIAPDMLPELKAPKDTTRYGEDDEDDLDGIVRADSMKYKPSDKSANQYNAINDLMEGRYLPQGESFRKRRKWMRDLYLQVGVGAEKITPPHNNFEISTMPMVQLGAGKALDRISSVRGMLHAAWGYQRDRDYSLQKFGLKAEYLYNLSSYFAGYNPTRLLNVSAILGVGGQYSKMENESGISGEMHLGGQLKFFTGPNAYIAVEPYVGFGTDQMDVSGKNNWRGVDIFYGANLNFIYYLRSNLTEESWKRLIVNRDSTDQLSTDGQLESWQQPWFIHFATGPSLMNSPNLGMGETLGTEISISGGKWLSPVLGLRATLFSRTNVWRKVQTEAMQASFHPAYAIDRHNVYTGFRLEAMFNPFGFFKNFHWDKPYGLFVAAGMERGWLQKTQSEPLSCASFGWGGGLNLWYQLTAGLKVSVEPRYMHNEYRIPYNNVAWYKRFNDDNVTINIGLTIEQRDDRRFYNHKYEYEYVVDKLRTFTVGLGGGLNFLQTEGAASKGTGVGLNGLLFGEYHFDRLKGARLGVEFINMGRRENLTDYIDYNMDYPEEGNAPVQRQGLFRHQYQMLLVSLSGQVDLNYLMMHYRPQRFRLSAFAGPTLVYMMKYSCKMNEEERIMENHQVVPVDADAGKVSFGAHLGFKLQYHWKKHICFHLTPTVYTLISTKMPGVDFTKLRLMETINVGAQYSF